MNILSRSHRRACERSLYFDKGTGTVWYFCNKYFMRQFPTLWGRRGHTRYPALRVPRHQTCAAHKELKIHSGVPFKTGTQLGSTFNGDPTSRPCLSLEVLERSKAPRPFLHLTRACSRETSEVLTSLPQKGSVLGATTINIPRIRPFSTTSLPAKLYYLSVCQTYVHVWYLNFAFYSQSWEHSSLKIWNVRQRSTKDCFV